MAIWDVIRWSLRQIRIRLMESLLIILSLGLGVAVVCSVVGLVENFTKQAISSTNLRQYQLISSENSYSPDEVDTPLRKIGPVKTARTEMTVEDFWALEKAQIDGLRAAWITRSFGELRPGVQQPDPTGPGKEPDYNAQRKWEEENIFKICMASPEVFDIASLKLVKGDLFRETDVQNKNKVVVLGDKFAAKYYPGKNPVGQKLQLQNGVFTVIGVVHHDFAEGDKDDYIQGVDSRSQLNMIIYMPYFSYPVNWGEKEGTISAIFLQATDKVNPGVFYGRLKEYVQDRYDGGITVLSDYLNVQQARHSYLQISQVIGILACGALLIAAINILNLMTARVLRRYKQIGISVALGASRQDLFRIFLVEAVLLGFIGSIIGILLSFGAMKLLGKIIYQQLDVSLLTLLTGIGVAFLTSLIFGLYPAKQAAAVPPVDALKRD